MAVGAQALPSESDRLVATGRFWITEKLFDPWLAHHGEVDWDQSLIEALPKIRSAQTLAEYKEAVTSMMRSVAHGIDGPVTGQRILVHYGFTPEAGGSANPFYSAFLNKPGAEQEAVAVPMGGFNASVTLSELAASLPNVPPPPAPHIYTDTYPATELRILAAYKIWGVLHYFFAYRDLIDEDWDGLLPQFLPRLIAAKDALEYNLVIAEWLTHAADSFTVAHSATLAQYFGEASPGLRVRIVEKHVTVTEVLDPEATQAGVKVGDIIKTVDGETLVDRFKRQSEYVPASTAQRQGFEVVNRILNGADGSSAQLTIEDHLGNRKEITLKRKKPSAETSREALKLLRAGVGYADLTQLKTAQVDALFEKFHNAPAIIFDMRGMPAAQDCASAIAARLTNEPDVPAAIITGPIVAAPDVPHGSIASPSSSYFFIETLGHSAQVAFRGKTVMLVDERTIDGGEEAGLFLEAANKTEFIGSPTAGAHSIVSNFTVPGGITISFSGQDIRHANGGKLQRLGLQPNVNAVPTLIGIRTGKDEVLARALDYVVPKLPNPKTLPSRAE